MVFRQMQRYTNRSVIRKTGLRVAIIFLTAFIVMTIAVMRIFVSQMSSRIINDKQELVDEITRGVDNLFDTLSTPLLSLASQKSVPGLLDDDLVLYSSEWMKCIRDIETNLSKIHLYYDYVLEVAIINSESQIMFSLVSSLNHNYDFVASGWFQDALTQERALKYAPPHGSDHFYQTYTGQPYLFTVIYPVTAKNRTVGYILCEVDATRISHIFHEGSPRALEGYCLVDSNGTIIFDYLGKERNDLPDEENPILKYISSPNTPVQTIGDHLYIGKQLSSTGWYVLSETNMQAITKPVNDIVRLITVILIIAIIICVILLDQIMRRIQKPVSQLIDRISSYDGTGSVDLKSVEIGYGEFQSIRTKFEEMADKINTLINDVYAAQLHQRDMELQMLVSQINPHFLYNVLQIIHGEAVLQNNRKIEDMIISLGEMLRYAIDRSRDEATVREEIQYLTHYLQFYDARFPGLFQYTIACPSQFLDAPILKFILQPLVENCFRHGFHNRKSGCIITIRITSQEDRLLIEIQDNGYGIPPDRLAELMDSMTDTRRASCVGIANTNARIKLKYGESYGISIESAEGEYTLIRMSLPIKDWMDGKEGNENV